MTIQTFFNPRGVVVIGLLALALIGIAVNSPIQPTGLIHSIPDEHGSFSFATGTYIGNGTLLTNWHVLKTLRSRQEYFKLPLWNEHIYNFDIPIEWVVFTEKSI